MTKVLGHYPFVDDWDGNGPTTLGVVIPSQRRLLRGDGLGGLESLNVNQSSTFRGSRPASRSATPNRPRRPKPILGPYCARSGALLGTGPDNVVVPGD